MTDHERRLVALIAEDAQEAEAALAKGDVLLAQACLASIELYARQLDARPTDEETP